MHTSKIAMLATICMGLATIAGAQNDDATNTFSPYSFYGVGDLSTPGFAFHRGMGGIGIGLRTNRTINYVNPAAMTVQDSLSFMFDIGGEMQNYYLSTVQNSTAANSMNIHHIALSFPVWRKTVLALSVMPYSNVGYKISQKETDPAKIIAAGGNITEEHRGEGGLNQILIGLGFSLDNVFSAPLWKRISIGGQAQYIFGSIDRYNNIKFDNSAVSNSHSGQLIRASNFTFGLGVQYDHPIDDYNLTVGATYQFANNMSVEKTIFDFVVRSANDSVRFIVDENAHLYAPPSLGLGIGIRRGAKWMAGVDYTFRNWNTGAFNISSSKTFKAVPEHIFRVGFERTPNRYDIRYFMKRWSYRAGFFYESTYMQFDNTIIKNYGITGGIGIPIGNRNNAVNMSAEIGQRGTTDNYLVRELYWKMSLSISLYDIWFIKPRFE